TGEQPRRVGALSAPLGSNRNWPSFDHPGGKACRTHRHPQRRRCFRALAPFATVRRRHGGAWKALNKYCVRNDETPGSDITYSYCVTNGELGMGLIELVVTVCAFSLPSQ